MFSGSTQAQGAGMIWNGVIVDGVAAFACVVLAAVVFVILHSALRGPRK